MLAEMMLSIQDPPLRLHFQDIRGLLVAKSANWKERFEEHRIDFEAQSMMNPSGVLPIASPLTNHLVRTSKRHGRL